MTPRAKAAPEPAAKRSEDRLRTVAVDENTGDIVLELTRRGRIYTTIIPAADSVTMIEAAALCGLTRSTVYNWAKPRDGRYSYSTPAAPLAVKDGRVELPELRRYLQALGRWWLMDHEAAKLISDHGPVREVKK